MTIRKLIEAGQAILDLHDGFMRGDAVDEEAARRLHHAACFGSAAYVACPLPDAATGAMLRAFALALIDPRHPDLDYLRAENDPTGKVIQ